MAQRVAMDRGVKILHQRRKTMDRYRRVRSNVEEDDVKILPELPPPHGGGDPAHTSNKEIFERLGDLVARPITKHLLIARPPPTMVEMASHISDGSSDHFLGGLIQVYQK